MTIRLCCLSTSIQKKLKLSTKLVDNFKLAEKFVNDLSTKLVDFF